MVKISTTIVYIVSSLICGILIFGAMFIFQNHNNSSGYVFKSPKDGIIYFLFWILIGLVITIVLGIAEKFFKNSIVELLISAIVPSLFMIYIGHGIQTTLEGLSVVLGLIGFVIGIIIFFLSRLLLNWFYSSSQIR